jgi:hypothetical protein
VLTTKEVAMIGRSKPPLIELMSRILNAATRTGRAIENWVRAEKELSDEPAVGKHVLGQT